MDQMHAGFRMPAISAPPLMNQPPQIFGGYSEHGMPLHQLPPDLTAHMFGDPNSLMEDANEAKRRRIARVRAFGILGRRGRNACRAAVDPGD